MGAMKPFYVGQMFFFFLPVIFMIPGAMYMVGSHYVCHAKEIALEEEESANEDMQRRIADLKNLRAKQLKAQQTEEGRRNFEETRKLRTEYNELLAEFHRAGFEDLEALSSEVADHHAIDRLGDEDKLCVSELFAGDHDDDPETEDRVELVRLLSFGKTLRDRLKVMVVVICFLVYPTIARKVFQSLSCISNLYD